MTDQIEKTEFKDCGCGSRIRLMWRYHPSFPLVDIGIAECSYCGDSHFVMLGDHDEVKACAADMQAFFESRGKGVDLDIQSGGPQCKSH